MPAIEAKLHTSSGVHAINVRAATNFFTRFAGLMLSRRLQPDEALLLTKCPSVHTAFMRYAIDIVYLDDRGSVLKCVPNLKPWRASFSGFGSVSRKRAAHTLELAVGTIARVGMRAGDRLQHPLLQQRAAVPEQSPGSTGSKAASSTRQRGSAMIEFVFVGPVVTMLGLSLLQYGMLFFAKNQINHATFMAARAGAMGNAKVATIQDAYINALIPLYGGGTDEAQLSEAQNKARADLIDNGLLNIELMNPTKESFDDWNDAGLQNTIGGGRRVIPNSDLALRDPNEIRPNSGQNIQDANLIKLRVTHGYEPKVPLSSLVYNRYLRWMDTGSDPHYTAMVNAGRIPVVSHVTLNMHSDAIEPDNPISLPGPGNNGNPTNPGDPPVMTDPPPNCLTMGCTVEGPPLTPTDPGGGGDGGGGICTGSDCPPCTASTPISQAG